MNGIRLHNESQSIILDKLSLSRRSFLNGLLTTGIVTTLAPTILIPSAMAHTTDSIEKALNMYNIHTGETLKKCVFWAKGQFVNESEQEIQRFFRDYRTGTQHPIDQKLLNILHQITTELDTTEPIHLISGYRSPKTNAMLRHRSRGVAKKSRHLSGEAADFTIPGKSLKVIQAVAKKCGSGGVGRYTQFVHVDTGPIRAWGKA